MNPTRRLSIADLSPETHRVLGDLRDGKPVFVESGGKDEAVLVDITDYRLLRSALYAMAQMLQVDRDMGLSEDALPPAHDAQARYNQIMLHHLSGGISLSRAAELLDCSAMELRTRLDRLGLPQRPAPSSVEEARRDAETALDWVETGDS